MKTTFTSFLTILAASLASVAAGNEQAGSRSDPTRSTDGVWQAITERSIGSTGERPIVPNTFRTVRLDRPALDQILARVPMELTAAARSREVVLTLPMPDGRFARFRIVESPMMEAGLAAKFPEIKTYSGQGLDDPTATAKVDLTPQGFHGMVLSSGATVYVDPYAKGDTSNYIAYYTSNAQRQDGPSVCLVGDDPSLRVGVAPPSVLPLSNGTMLRTYRLALAATGQYTAAVGGGTVLGAMAAMTTSMNRVNGIYERELALRMSLVANNDLIVYTDGSTDPYTNADGFAMLGQNQTNLDSVIGAANYDIGHVFSTGGGGVASLRSPCSGGKARGVTGLGNPIGDPFDVDFVSHEMGHQWGGNHTFNGTTSNCAPPNRHAATAYEVGSGSTIQAYAGICGPENLQTNSNDYFHVESLNEMSAFIQVGGGSTCGIPTPTGNAIPTVSAGSSFTVPAGTPFTLTAVGADADGDAMTYAWEEYDLGTPSPPHADDGVRPLFRSFAPTASPSRTFPSLPYILNNMNVPPTVYLGTPPVPNTAGCGAGSCLTGEVLPSMNRTMTFQVSVRDNHVGGGGIVSASTQVTIVDTGAPFEITSILPRSPDGASLTGGTAQTVTWNVAGTVAAPINTASVTISLSVDGGASFPFIIAASTANDGAEHVTIPNVASTTTARLKVEALGNIFFDIDDADFAIANDPALPLVPPPGLPPPPPPTDSDGDGLTDAFESQFGLDPTDATGANGAGGDPDGDGFTNIQEQAAGSHPRGFFTVFFAEGATGGPLHFRTTFATANPGAAPASVLYRFLKTDGTAAAQVVSLGGLTRHTIDAATVPGLATAEFSAVCESDVRVVADRTMTWPGLTAYGSHAETSLDAPALRWTLAEGSTNGFNLFYLIQNPSPTAATVQVTYLRPGGQAPVVTTHTVAATSRFTLWVNLDDPALAQTDVSAVLTSTNGVPILVERAMYLDLPGQAFGAGHESAGVTTAATRWFFAEGATGSFFDLFLLLANPTPTEARVRADYLLPSGTVVTKHYTVGGSSRFTIWVDLEDPLLADTAVSTTLTVTNGVALVAERAMWWAGSPSAAAWYEAHNSPGATAAGTDWALAEGEVGGPRNLATFLLLANTSPFVGAAAVTLLFEDGTTTTRTFGLTGTSRFNLNVGVAFPSAVGRRFGAVVTSQATGAGTALLVVERAMYSDAGGAFWAAGTNALATRLAP